jgi:hypothetical protein
MCGLTIYTELSFGVNKTSYDLLLEIFRFTKDFRKEFKYTIGESLLKREGITLGNTRYIACLG